MLRSCDQYPTLDSLWTYLLELFDIHENLSYVAKEQKILYNDTIKRGIIKQCTHPHSIPPT